MSAGVVTTEQCTSAGGQDDDARFSFQWVGWHAALMRAPQTVFLIHLISSSSLSPLSGSPPADSH